MSCGYLIVTTVVLAGLVALAAFFVARFVAMTREPTIWSILAAIVVSLVALQIGAKLAVITEWLYTRAGMDPMAVCYGELRTGAFAATLVVIIAYVASFFVTFRRVRRG